MEDTELILAWGTNTQECHPIIFNHIRRGIKNGAKMVVINPRKIMQTKLAEKWLPVKIGTDIALANAMGHVIIKEGLYHREFVEQATEFFEEYKQSVESYTPERAASITGIPAEDIIEVARQYATAKRAIICWTMGLTQHHNGTDNISSIINLALLTGHVGKYGSGLNPLRGQNNVQGGGDMGCLPDRFPGGYLVTDEFHRNRIEGIWDAKVPPLPGKNQTAMLKAIDDREIKAMYIIGENPVVSDANLNHTKQLFEKLEFLVVQDIMMTQTAELADVILPAAGWAESFGTYTNGERRVQLIRPALKPPGEARDDCQIVQDIANRLGANWNYKHAEDIFEEIREVAENYRGITYRRLDEEGGIQWPCRDEQDPGKVFLHEDIWQWPLQRKRLTFQPVEHKLPLELPDKEYPFQLTTGRRLSFYNTGVLTQDYGPKVKGQDEYLEINPQDAEVLNISDGQEVIVASRRGELKVKTKVTEQSVPGTLFLSIHFPDLARTNLLTIDETDPVAGTAEFKACAVKIVV